MTSQSTAKLSFTETATTAWILVSTAFSIGGIVLSCFGTLDRTWCSVLLALGIFLAGIIYHRLNGRSWAAGGVRLKRFRKPFPLLYLLCAVGAFFGGAIHQPSNHDALCYRIPRLLHWLAEGRWHWIGGADTRMDFAAFGSDALILPAFATFRTLRFAFLGNAFTFLLLPGLVFTVFKAIGIRKSTAATWMWILPCASCYTMQAGSIGNDLLSCVYLLAALMFAFQAGKGNGKGLTLAILSAALMTGVKATNLPLLLPIGICLAPALFRSRKCLALAICAGLVSLPVSFFPTAVLNTIHSGNWTGVSDDVLRIKEPLAGVAGNSLLLGSASLAPAVFPSANRVNDWFNSNVEKPSLRWIKEAFVDFRMTHPQLAAEESSGLGLGVFGALILGTVGAWRGIGFQRLCGIGGCVAGGFWIAALFYMVKLGNCGVPRYFAPYYPGLMALPLLLVSRAGVFRERWWNWCSLALIVPILPALACNPSRPLLPMRKITELLSASRVAPGVVGRMRTVYDVYSKRYDVYSEVREMLPPDAKMIAFAGTSGESEFSFWLPLGARRVLDYHKSPDGMIPNPTGFDAVVASTWGTNDRFGMTPGDLAECLGWKVIGTMEVRALASQEPVGWSVLVPGTALPFDAKRP